MGVQAGLERNSPWWARVGARGLDFLWLPALAVLAACSPDAPARIGATVRDSAGIQIVESFSPAWAEGGGWTLDPKPEVEIGSEPFDSTRVLFEVNGVLRLDEGRIIVANRGTTELLWFDSLGTFQRATGRKGEGPGEFMFLVRLYHCAEDAVVVNEGLRVSKFDSQGRFVEAKRIDLKIAPKEVYRLQGVSEDCSSLLMLTFLDSAPPLRKVYGIPATLFWWDPQTGARDTLAEFPLYEIFGMVRRGRVLPWPLPWGKGAHWAIVGNRVFIGRTDQSDFRAFGRHGELERILRRPTDSGPVTEADRKMFAERREELIDNNDQIRSYLPELDAFPVPDERPAYSGLLADDEGNLWVRLYPTFPGGWLRMDVPWDRTADPEVWTVFDETGRWLGSLPMPPGFEVLTVQDDRVMGIWRDAYDVEHVQIFRLNKGGGR